jgi:hypothetical protein
MAVLSQFARPRIKQTAGKNRVGSERCLVAAEFLEFAACDEIKKRKLAHQGALREAICGVERAAVPARGLANRSRAASDPASPALRPGREELASKRGLQWRKLLQDPGKRSPKLSQA